VLVRRLSLTVQYCMADDNMQAVANGGMLRCGDEAAA
jgi:hypothetical protein